MAFHPSHEDEEDLDTFEAKIRTEIRVKAPIEDVWDVLVDVDAWPTWNPCLTIDGELREGARIDVTVATPGGGSRSLRGRVETVAPPSELAWHERSLIPGVFEGDHVVELMRRGPKQTKVVHRERFEGLLVPLFKQSDLDDTRLGYEAMNRALKERVEQTTR